MLGGTRRALATSHLPLAPLHRPGPPNTSNSLNSPDLSTRFTHPPNVPSLLRLALPCHSPTRPHPPRPPQFQLRATLMIHTTLRYALHRQPFIPFCGVSKVGNAELAPTISLLVSVPHSATKLSGGLLVMNACCKYGDGFFFAHRRRRTILYATVKRALVLGWAGWKAGEGRWVGGEGKGV